MQKSLNWLPIHESHAIDVMAVKVDFAQQLPLLLLRKVLRIAEAKAFEAGLKSRHSVGMNIPVPIEGPPIVFRGIQGQLFNDLAEPAEGAPVGRKIAEQLQVDQQSITYRTWRYVSWSWQIERLRTMILPVMEEMSGVVALSAVQLEYLDKFRLDAEPEEGSIKLIIRQGCELVPPHVLEKAGLWHSYTGSFLPSSDGTRQLELVNIDVVDQPNAETPTQTRWMNILTVRQDTFSPEALETGGASGAEVFEVLASMHPQLKRLLGRIITDELSARIFLRST